MAYKKFQSEQLFTGYELLNSDHVLITDQEGKLKILYQQQMPAMTFKISGHFFLRLYQLSLPPGIKSFEKCDPARHGSC